MAFFIGRTGVLIDFKTLAVPNVFKTILRVNVFLTAHLYQYAPTLPKRSLAGFTEPLCQPHNSQNRCVGFAHCVQVRRDAGFVVPEVQRLSAFACRQVNVIGEVARRPWLCFRGHTNQT
ncbi:hypothetical protein CBL_00082 [Carabus blaptoides fortunei]